MVSYNLRHNGFEVEIADDGEKALEQALLTVPDPGRSIYCRDNSSGRGTCSHIDGHIPALDTNDSLCKDTVRRSRCRSDQHQREHYDPRVVHWVCTVIVTM